MTQARSDGGPPLLVLDVVAVLAFAAVGRRSHAEGLTVAGLLETAWPFLVGVVVGWVLSRAWRRPLALWPVATSVWVGVLVVGMALRRATGEGTAASFVVVATLVLGLLLFGWRVVAVLVVRRRS